MLDILMITYNRPEYTERSLGRLLETCNRSMRVTVWHNGTDAKTLRVVQSFANHPNFADLYTSRENRKLREPTNWFWSKTTAKYVAKVDDDCLVQDGWAEKLMEVHELNTKLGAIACWMYYDEDFVPELAQKKIANLDGGHRILLNAWVGGSGYVMKRALVQRHGPIAENESFTGYCLRSALAGWQHGWYFPFIHQEHMDDPRSPFCGFTTEQDFSRFKPLSAINSGVQSLSEWRLRAKYMARVIQEASPDAREHMGWRLRISNLRRRVSAALGIPPPWKRRSSRAKLLRD